MKYKGRYCFHRCLSICSHFGGVSYPAVGGGTAVPGPGGGVPHPAELGIPSQVQAGGTPTQVHGVTPSS